MIQLAMFDVDGTTHEAGGWTPGALRLIKDFAQAGVTVALCSGRAIPSLKLLGDEVPEISYLAASSGSLVVHRSVDGWQTIGSRLLAPQLVNQVWADALALELPIWGYSQAEWLVPKYYPILDEEIAILGGEQPTFAPIVDRVDITKLLALPQTETHEAFLAELASHTELAVVPSYPGRIDIIDAASFDSKGGNEIVAHLGADWTRTFAVGDGGNDVGMLSKAAVSCALPKLRVADLGPQRVGQQRFDCADLVEVRAVLAANFGWFA